MNRHIPDAMLDLTDKDDCAEAVRRMMERHASPRTRTDPTMNQVEVIQAETLLPCPNPWCAQSERLMPSVVWTGPLNVMVECQSCGLQGPAFSPCTYDEDGEPVGTQDAPAMAIAAWNTRHTPSPDLVAMNERLVEALEPFADAAQWWSGEHNGGEEFDDAEAVTDDGSIRVRDLRRAREALSQAKGEGR